MHVHLNTFGPVCLRLPNLGGINPPWPVCPPYPVRRGILIHSINANKHFWPCIPSFAKPWGINPLRPYARPTPYRGILIHSINANKHFWPCMPSFAQPWGNQSPSPVCPGGCPPPYPVRRGILILSKTREQTLLALYAFVCQPWGNQSPSPVCPGACPPPYPVHRGILVHSNTLEQTLLALYAVCQNLGVVPDLPRTPGILIHSITALSIYDAKFP
jgi:hypothetical protein